MSDLLLTGYQRWTLDGVTYDTGRFLIRKLGLPDVQLSPIECALLGALISGNGRVVLHAALMVALLDSPNVDGDRDYLNDPLRERICCLRRKLPAGAIINVRGAGYRLNC